jgi:predicted AAA+ superfamily ATPase
MRRTGKTTIVRELLNQVSSGNKIYIDLERYDNRELFSDPNYDNIPVQLTRRGLDFSVKAWIFLDEIQLVPPIMSVLKYLYDHYFIKFIITGSSSFYLRNFFSDSLAGRKKIFELYPLDFGEFIIFREIPSGAVHALTFPNYP